MKKYYVDFRQIDSRQIFCVKSTFIDAFSKKWKQQFFAKSKDMYRVRVDRSYNFCTVYSRGVV